MDFPLPGRTFSTAIYLVTNFYRNLTDPVPPELITVDFITKYPLLNFQSLAKRTGNAAALSAINGTIKAVEGCLTPKNQQ